MIENKSIITNFSGFFKIWRVSKLTGEPELVVDKKNLILFQGSDLLALALGGFRNAKISNMYVGYVNKDPIDPFTPTTIDKEYSVPFTSYGEIGGAHEEKGYLRLPLAYAPTYNASTSDYESNQVLFTSIISSTQENTGGAEFLYADDVSGTPSHIFEVALSAALDSSSPNGDKIFSRANFTPITYDQNYNLTITWGIQFLS